jgi:hypothetical protein
MLETYSRVLKGMTGTRFGGHGELTWLDTNTRS